MNEKYRAGDKVPLPVPSGKKTGDPVRVGSLNGVCATDRARVDGLSPFNADGSVNATYNWGGGNKEGEASVWLDGAHDFTVTFARAIGDPVYILADGTALTDVATGNNLYGHALSAKGAVSGPLTVRIAN